MSVVFSSDRPLKSECVTFVVDTNLLVEFEALGQINWNVLCPDATAVRIVVPSTVVREMDKHKQRAGRLRRRALAFNKILKSIEDGDGTVAALEGKKVDLTLMLMERYSRDELPRGKLSFDIADDVIVGEAVRFSRDCDDVVFLSDDNNARRTAREMGMDVARPPEDWRRAEPMDRRDARIAELERQLGAQPRIALRLVTGDRDGVLFEKLQTKDIPEEFCERLGQAILNRNPGIDRDELFRRHNLPRSESRFQHIIEPWSVTEEQVESYCRKYQRYTEAVIAWSKNLPKIMSELDFVAPMGLEISNEGEAFAQDVEVTVQAPNGYKFLAKNLVRAYLDAELEVPEPPSGVREFGNIPSIWEQQERHRRDAFGFYARNGPTKDEAVSSICYECERFRHGVVHVLWSSLLMDENAPLGGKLVVQVSSASMADTVEAIFPVKQGTVKPQVDYRAYLSQRLFLFSEDYRSAISEVLEEI